MTLYFMPGTTPAGSFLSLQLGSVISCLGTDLVELGLSWSIFIPTLWSRVSSFLIFGMLRSKCPFSQRQAPVVPVVSVSLHSRWQGCSLSHCCFLIALFHSTKLWRMLMCPVEIQTPEDKVATSDSTFPTLPKHPTTRCPGRPAQQPAAALFSDKRSIPIGFENTSSCSYKNPKAASVSLS